MAGEFMMVSYQQGSIGLGGVGVADGGSCVRSGDDREPGVVAGSLATPVEDVLLEQGEVGFHGGAVVGGGDLAHRTGQVVAAERGEEAPGRNCAIRGS